MPGWFSGLTQLTSLCKFHSFPLDVLGLPKLARLAIKNLSPMTMTKDVMQMAACCCLKNFALGVMDPAGDQSYSLDSQLYLLELCQCLSAKGVEVDVAKCPTLV